jgi:CspA family cold shock protein
MPRGSMRRAMRQCQNRTCHENAPAATARTLLRLLFAEHGRYGRSFVRLAGRCHIAALGKGGCDLPPQVPTNRPAAISGTALRARIQVDTLPPADIGVRHKTSMILVVRDRRLRLPFCFWCVIICAVEANSIGADMSKGTVKWFNSQKGYGFIQPQGGGKDVFVHISAVERAGLSGLNEGQVIEYEEVSNRGKTSAEHLKVQR